MYLIDSTTEFFYGKNSVPNIAEIVSESKDVLNNIIETKLPELLCDYALGIELFNDFKDNLENGQLKPTAEQKWKDLVNGKEYTKDSKTHVWKGLVSEVNGKKESFLVSYVFHLWLEDNTTYVSSNGEQAMQVANSNTVMNNRRLIDAWNEFLKFYQGVNYYANGYIGWHKGILYKDYCYGEHSQLVSLIRFLKDHNEEYPTALNRRFRDKNSFNL